MGVGLILLAALFFQGNIGIRPLATLARASV
jgi:hypothetical protein